VRATNLDEYVQVVLFILQGEAILARANAEAAALVGKEVPVGSTGLRPELEAATKLKHAFATVYDFQRRGIRRLDDVPRLIDALRLMYEELCGVSWRMSPGDLDELLSKHGIRLAINVDLTEFERMHPAKLAEEQTPAG